MHFLLQIPVSPFQVECLFAEKPATTPRWVFVASETRFVHPASRVTRWATSRPNLPRSEGVWGPSWATRTRWLEGSCPGPTGGCVWTGGGGPKTSSLHLLVWHHSSGGHPGTPGLRPVVGITQRCGVPLPQRMNLLASATRDSPHYLSDCLTH